MQKKTSVILNLVPVRLNLGAYSKQILDRQYHITYKVEQKLLNLIDPQPEESLIGRRRRLTQGFNRLTKGYPILKEIASAYWNSFLQQLTWATSLNSGYSPKYTKEPEGVKEEFVRKPYVPPITTMHYPVMYYPHKSFRIDTYEDYESVGILRLAKRRDFLMCFNLSNLLDIEPLLISMPRYPRYCKLFRRQDGHWYMQLGIDITHRPQLKGIKAKLNFDKPFLMGIDFGSNSLICHTGQVISKQDFTDEHTSEFYEKDKYLYQKFITRTAAHLTESYHVIATEQAGFGPHKHWQHFQKGVDSRIYGTHKMHYKVNPRDTSRKCSLCGWIAEENPGEHGEKYFICKRCFNRLPRDMNAARNILQRGIFRGLHGGDFSADTQFTGLRIAQKRAKASKVKFSKKMVFSKLSCVYDLEECIAQQDFMPLCDIPWLDKLWKKQEMADGIFKRLKHLGYTYKEIKDSIRQLRTRYDFRGLSYAYLARLIKGISYINSFPVLRFPKGTFSLTAMVDKELSYNFCQLTLSGYKQTLMLGDKNSECRRGNLAYAQATLDAVEECWIIKDNAGYYVDFRSEQESCTFGCITRGGEHTAVGLCFKGDTLTLSNSRYKKDIVFNPLSATIEDIDYNNLSHVDNEWVNDEIVTPIVVAHKIELWYEYINHLIKHLIDNYTTIFVPEKLTEDDCIFGWDSFITLLSSAIDAYDGSVHKVPDGDLRYGICNCCGSKNGIFNPEPSEFHCKFCGIVESWVDNRAKSLLQEGLRLLH